MSNSILPAALYRAEQVRELDRLTIEEHGVNGFALMRRAGKSAARVQRRYWPDARRLVILCGSGNNAGDGYVVAGIAVRRGQQVHLLQIGDPGRLGGDAARARDWALERGVRIEDRLPGDLGRRGDLIIDALLGTGLKGDVRGPYRDVMQQAAASGAPVLAIDLPSGLSADTGAVLGSVLPATVTVTFIGLKCGQFSGRGPAVCGRLLFDALDAPADVYDRMTPAALRSDPAGWSALLGRRARDAHKGHFGHVLVIGGETGFGGAALMAAESAARAGAGLVSLATRPEHIAPALARRPELMAHAVASGQDLPSLLERASVVVLGPGLNDSAWSQQLYREACLSGLPMVVDAGGLRLLSQQAAGGRRSPEQLVLTPHPGEAAGLLGCSIEAVQADRFAAVRQLAENYRCTAVLKGSGSLIASPGERPVTVCDLGNPGMASGGMGDVLAGLIGALLAQGLPAGQAAEAGVWLHARAADEAVLATGEQGLLATDLFAYLPGLMQRLCG